jgi:hypothetical protein
MLHQPFPTPDVLCRHLDLTKTRLSKMIEVESEAVYTYVVPVAVLEGQGLGSTGGEDGYTRLQDDASGRP